LNCPALSGPPVSREGIGVKTPVILRFALVAKQPEKRILGLASQPLWCVPQRMKSIALRALEEKKKKYMKKGASV
jgi:hypothetical protein